MHKRWKQPRWNHLNVLIPTKQSEAFKVCFLKSLLRENQNKSLSGSILPLFLLFVFSPAARNTGCSSALMVKWCNTEKRAILHLLLGGWVFPFWRCFLIHCCFLFLWRCFHQSGLFSSFLFLNWLGIRSCKVECFLRRVYSLKFC